MAEPSSASEIRIPGAVRATKTKLEMVWTQVEQNSLLMVAGDTMYVGLALTATSLSTLLTFARGDIIPIKIGTA